MLYEPQSDREIVDRKQACSDVFSCCVALYRLLSNSLEPDAGRRSQSRAACCVAQRAGRATVVYTIARMEFDVGDELEACNPVLQVSYYTPYIHM
eukprot:6172804-Pleurochrysis_carterae.AAC.3